MKTLYRDIADSLDRFHEFQREFRTEVHPNTNASDTADYFRFWYKKYTRASCVIISNVGEVIENTDIISV